jgi:glycosyltransferase involved in cell wall biosynthesis
MICAWSLHSLGTKPDVLIIGTDPVLSLVAAIPWKLVRKGTRVVHWCFDLYPEAAVCDGILKPGPLLAALRSIMRAAYRRVDLIADVGDCMRQRLCKYSSPARMTTLPPWAVVESPGPLPTDPIERTNIFGNAELGLMYSGNFGRAHSFTELLTIARAMRDVDAHFAFSVRGNRAAEFRDAVTSHDHNISFVSFAPHDRLGVRLSAADIHVVSLRSEWTGTVMPSKFFGALAVGRPVLFIGSDDSFAARIIRKYRVGWVCSPGAELTIVDELRTLSKRLPHMQELREHCYRVYQTHFSRELLLDGFDLDLRALNEATTQK